MWNPFRKVVRKMKIKSLTNILIQILMFVFQGINATSGITEDDLKPVVAGIIAVVQGIIAIIAHYSNPDATPVETAYVSKKDRKISEKI